MTTKAGDLELSIPKLRQGSFSQALLERRRRFDQALLAVVMEAYLHRVSTRKIDDLVKALDADSGISKFEVSRICAGLDEEIAVFRDRKLAELDYLYVFLDATYCKARVNNRVVSQAVVVAVGVAADGRREVLGFDVGDTENEAFRTAFLRTMKARGPGGVKRVMSDAHIGLKKAIETASQGKSWQRCRVHLMHSVLSAVPRCSQEIVASIIRTIFTGFSGRHWWQIWFTNPLERVNKEIKRRTDVVSVFPNPAALLRLAGAVLIEQHDEWEAGDRRYFSDASMFELATMNAVSHTPVEEVTPIPVLAAA